MPQSVTLTITDIAPLGDGVGRLDGLPVYVPYTMEGDVVRAEIVQKNATLMRARMTELLTPSHNRQDPPCAYFGRCGGCSVQHLAPPSYRAFKEQIAQRMMHELQQPMHLLRPLIEVGAASRRRVQWAVQVQKGQVTLGYQQAKSHEMVAIDLCPVSMPQISAMLAPLKACLQSMKKPSAISSIALTMVHEGIDMVVHLRQDLHAHDRTLLQQFGDAYAIARIATHDYEVIHQHADVSVMFGTVRVALPIGAFLQASEQAQYAMTSLIQNHLQGCSTVMDMYAGCGTYSFPLVPHMQHIFAYEGSSDMVAVMHNAIHHHGLEQKMTVSCRDLFTHPLRSSDMPACDGLVINPPRNGALPQIKQLINAPIARIAMISCNPATFIRDASLLLQHGYQLASLTPVDQFVWNSHLEVVGLFHARK
ncbi:MAG: class I SAM-dependent RNA methyltransferase [Alphaproteobacteria bacterium]|nr:MAG: class I SAM-dependent RNA methyltransferase [Alphaproteobacteria bacterium]TAF15950.1 MAG: class I SAM-dependent RNA methyltransferase [Alphaproteobacteria bacterium]TAF41933.1 MAG: class I SAM-dependent RNA methyltransferase [Alphaproteobacteria bacterium]TAF76764.1 MAG: class I SAM-dependent RNA methyltransferase [Alphaproteobacteria bacterium]